MNSNYLNCKAYFFDLDHTLLQANTSFRFGWYLYRENILPFFKMLYLLWWYGIHLLGGISIPSLHVKTMKTFFLGRSMQELHALTNSFLDRHLHAMQNVSIVSLLQKVKEEGKFVAILSSSPDFLVEAIAKRWNIHHFLGTRYALDGCGMIKGLSLSVQGSEKADYVKKLNFTIQEMAAFSDSIHDLPLLKAVGFPVAVNPDGKLKRVSREFGWEVLH